MQFSRSLAAAAVPSLVFLGNSLPLFHVIGGATGKPTEIYLGDVFDHIGKSRWVPDSGHVMVALVPVALAALVIVGILSSTFSFLEASAGSRTWRSVLAAALQPINTMIACLAAVLSVSKMLTRADLPFEIDASRSASTYLRFGAGAYALAFSSVTSIIINIADAAMICFITCACFRRYLGKSAPPIAPTSTSAENREGETAPPLVHNAAPKQRIASSNADINVVGSPSKAPEIGGRKRATSVGRL